jgi:hypothetical protein
MSGQAYVGTAKRTFAQALVHLLETDYGLLGSHKILELLVADVEELVEQFFPIPQRLRPGWMVFTGTKASGPKAYPGQSAANHTLVTLAWPVLLPEDVQQLVKDYLLQRPDDNGCKIAWYAWLSMASITPRVPFC